MAALQTLASMFQNAEMASEGFRIAQNLPVNTHNLPVNEQKPTNRKPEIVGKYAAWFREHADWFIDPLDIKIMQIILTQLQYYDAESLRRVVITKIYATVDEKEIQNWYTKYTMFDPTMGMYDPSEARSYFYQRMLKRLNMVAYLIENPPRSRRR